MAQRIRPHKETTDGDGFQYKPERIRVVSKHKTTELRATVNGSEVKMAFVSKENFAVAEYVENDHKISLTTVISAISIVVTIVGSIITLVGVLK